MSVDLVVTRGGHKLVFRRTKFEIFPRPPLFSILRDGQTLFTSEDKAEALGAFSSWLGSQWLYQLPRAPKREVALA